MATTTRDPAPARPMVATGSELVVIDRWQARAYEQVIAAAAKTPPLGWNPTGRQDAPVGYDLVLATPRTLSALVGWRLARSDRDLTGDIMRAHFAAVRDVADEFTAAVGADVPVLVNHLFDSAGQSWLHHHVLYGGLACLAESGWTDPPGGDEWWSPLRPATVAQVAERMIFGYHLFVRRGVAGLIGELGLSWDGLAADGSCEVWGLAPQILDSIGLPARPLAEIHACEVEIEDESGGV
jgi:hypothetical protein